MLGMIALALLVVSVDDDDYWWSKLKRFRQKVNQKISTPDGTRTRNLLFRRQKLYH
jgi:hypothetical protein